VNRREGPGSGALIALQEALAVAGIETVGAPLNDPSMQGARIIDIATLDQDGRLRR